MGHNKNQMKWNQEESVRSIRKMGVDPTVWGELVVAHFANCELSQTDMQMNKFHHAVREVKETGE